MRCCTSSSTGKAFKAAKRQPFSFIPSAEGEAFPPFRRLCRRRRDFLYRLLTVSGSADTAVRRWRRLYAQSERGQWPPSAAGGVAARRRGQEGKDNQGFLSPLNSPNFPLAATPCGRASKCEGPTDVFGAPQGIRLIEAELFAGTGKRPAQAGRALLCAAAHARKIRGITALYNVPDARNRAPVTPV